MYHQWLSLLWIICCFFYVQGKIIEFIYGEELNLLFCNKRWNVVQTNERIAVNRRYLANRLGSVHLNVLCSYIWVSCVRVCVMIIHVWHQFISSFSWLIYCRWLEWLLRPYVFDYFSAVQRSLVRRSWACQWLEFPCLCPSSSSFLVVPFLLAPDFRVRSMWSMCCSGVAIRVLCEISRTNRIGIVAMNCNWMNMKNQFCIRIRQ